MLLLFHYIVYISIEAGNVNECNCLCAWVQQEAPTLFTIFVVVAAAPWAANSIKVGNAAAVWQQLPRHYQ